MLYICHQFNLTGNSLFFFIILMICQVLFVYVKIYALVTSILHRILSFAIFFCRSYIFNATYSWELREVFQFFIHSIFCTSVCVLFQLWRVLRFSVSIDVVCSLKPMSVVPGEQQQMKLRWDLLEKRQENY